MSKNLQITGNATAGEARKFKDYAKALGIDESALATLLLARELFRKALQNHYTISGQPCTKTITAHFESPQFKQEFASYALTLNLSQRTAAGAVFCQELKEQWLAKEVRGGLIDLDSL